MAIDWFTTSAQIVNFLILLWLLKKFLFKPISKVMDKREQLIANRFQDAQLTMEEAESLKQQYHMHLQQIQKEKDKILAQAIQQADAEKAQLLKKVNQEIADKKQQFEADLQKQQQELTPLIRKTILEKALAISRKILTQLANQELEHEIIDKFLQHLSNLPEQQKSLFKQTINNAKQVRIISYFSLDSNMQQHLQKRLASFSPNCQLSFEQQDDLICGIALETDGKIWEWNIERYLTELDSELL